MSKFYQVPFNLNLTETLLNNNVPLIKLPKYVYFIDCIFKQSFHYTEGDFIPLHSSILLYVLNSKDYPKVIDNLRRWGIIEVNGKYLTGEYSKSYRLDHPYNQICILFQNENKEIEVNFKQLEKRVDDHFINNNEVESENVKKKLNKVCKNSVNEHDVLKSNFNKIYIDYEKAIKFTNEALFYKIKLKNKSIFKHIFIPESGWIDKKFTNKDNTFTEDNFNFYISTIKSITNKDVNYNICEKSGRVFNTLVNCPNQLLSCLYVDNKSPLYNVDISCSQPFLLSKFGKNIIKNDKCKTYGCKPSILTKELIKYINVYNTGNVKGLEAKGDIYTFLQQNCKKSFTRDEIKVKLYSELFFNNPEYLSEKSEIFSTFKRCFPEIAKLIVNYKIKHTHQEFCYQLQSLEASIVIDKICKILGKKYKDMIFFTKHDGILVFGEEEAKIVKDIMQVEISKFVGETVKLKLEKIEDPIIEPTQNLELKCNELNFERIKVIRPRKVTHTKKVRNAGNHYEFNYDIPDYIVKLFTFNYDINFEKEDIEMDPVQVNAIKERGRLKILSDKNSNVPFLGILN